MSQPNQAFLSQKITITLGETDKIIGSPTYGEPVLRIDTGGVEPARAVLVLMEVQASLLNSLVQQIATQQNRISELTKQITK